ncbi:hypothetical protein SAMN04487905_111110 [Actinopolyspora xinjiangensis]|uniref:Ig-like domain-containing protein n=2 Tax=Actinopolyspora xinjiangensis TaxID=405564 RepID=A0A1H0WAH4_9ACTN|nr:hypothetical protein SAMN04487905_111110 [Actinopolyspora xinjiangensis]
MSESVSGISGNRSGNRKFGTALAASLLCAAGITMVAPAAQGESVSDSRQDVSVHCASGGNANFTPGLMPVPKRSTVQFDGENKKCTDLADTGIVSGTFTGSFTAKMSCEVGAGDGVDGTAKITWKYDDGSTSKSTVSLTMSGQTLNEARFEGYVTEGPLEGERLEGTFSVDLFSAGASCTAGSFTGGLKQAPFEGSYTIG